MGNLADLDSWESPTSNVLAQEPAPASPPPAFDPYQNLDMGLGAFGPPAPEYGPPAPEPQPPPSYDPYVMQGLDLAGQVFQGWNAAPQIIQGYNEQSRDPYQAYADQSNIGDSYLREMPGDNLRGQPQEQRG